MYCCCDVLNVLRCHNNMEKKKEEDRHSLHHHPPTPATTRRRGRVGGSSVCSHHSSKTMTATEQSSSSLACRSGRLILVASCLCMIHSSMTLAACSNNRLKNNSASSSDDGKKVFTLVNTSSQDDFNVSWIERRTLENPTLLEDPSSRTKAEDFALRKRLRLKETKAHAKSRTMSEPTDRKQKKVAASATVAATDSNNNQGDYHRCVSSVMTVDFRIQRLLSLVAPESFVKGSYSFCSLSVRKLSIVCRLLKPKRTLLRQLTLERNKRKAAVYASD
eukprot:GHVS01080174.1.p1 GENE.GHVS01080174.1~~GHVS01080174.1.p1  ORF type:complete len:276 (+),score=51.44 GHVS01080174.1:157-984(+)